MADEIVPGVWRLHETRGCNVYLLRARDGRLVLVDTGFPSSAAGILRELTRLAPGEALAAILITHGHFDHAGAAGALRSTGTSVFAGRGDTRLLPDGRRVIAPQIGRTHLARRLLGRRMEGSLAIVDVALDGEVEVVPGIRAVPVPGHTPGSYCYIDEDRGIAFAGDLVISHEDRLSRAMTFANADDARYLRSLAEFAERSPGIGCPGHGIPVLCGFDEQLRELAAMPRRSLLSPSAMLDRARRLRSFGTQLSTVRRHPDGDSHPPKQS